METTTRDRVTLVSAVAVSVFILLSLVFTFVLALREIDTGAIWGKVFDLVSVLAGGLVGYIAGQNVERRALESAVLPEPDSEPLMELVPPDPGVDDDDDA